MIFDSSAVLAYLFGEPGGLAVAETLSGSMISTVNAAEVITKLIKRGVSPSKAIDILDSLEMTLLAWDQQSVDASVEFASLAWSHGLSLGDRACLTAARITGEVVVTAERDWQNLPDLRIIFQWIR